MRALDIDALAGHGPAPAAAAVPVPHEYVRPYDPEAFGLHDAPAGPYGRRRPPGRRARDTAPARPRSLLNAFVLAARADVPVAFPRERLDDAWPDVR